MFSNSELCNLIPHAEKMCLIDTVDHWDDDTILCTTQTHQACDNPLLDNGVLNISALIEYGAQAMAIHGALISTEGGKKMQEGYLAALKDVNFYQKLEINSIAFPLLIQATRKLASQGNMIYEFLITFKGNNLISGRATVVAVLTIN